MPDPATAIFTYTSHGTRWTLTDANGTVIEDSSDSSGLWSRAVQLARDSKPSRIILVDDKGDWIGDTEFTD